MNFDELYNYCNKLNESKCEKCLVCHIPIEQNDTHLKFACTHYYHPECIVTKPQNKWNPKQSYICMYCEKKSIPTLINGNNIKDLITATLENVSDNIPNKCNVIMKSGSKKGQECGRIKCNYHKTNVVNEMCQHLIKTGIKKGQTCNRTIPCSYHKITEIIV